MTAVVLAQSRPHPTLQAALGDQRSGQLDRELLRLAQAWARSLEPLCMLETGPAALGAAAKQAFTLSNGGPLLISSIAAAASLRPEHAEGALSDMRSGLDLSLGPATDGGWYLLALRSPRPELLSGDGDLTQGLLAAQQGGLSVGLLRSERELTSPAAARALLADPLCPSEIRTIIGSTIQ